MKNLFKKITLFACMVAICITSVISLVGCAKKPDPESQVMNIAVNPSIEFVLDNNDKVVSVSATNEDGAYILSKFTEFTGMNAQDAALKFLELSEQYGFIVEGSINNEKITISVSGEGDEDLYNKVKNKIETKSITEATALKWCERCRASRKRFGESFFVP